MEITKEKLDQILDGSCEYIVIETDEENPITIAMIKSDDVEVANGYRVRLKPI